MADTSRRDIKIFGIPFEEAFPDLEDAEVEWQGLDVEGPPLTGEVKRMRYKAGIFLGVIPCDNPSCQGGGFEVERVMDRMFRTGDAERAGIIVCPGWEGDEKPCVRSISYRIKLVYKSKVQRRDPLTDA
ncbi:MAG: hypothetical protein HY347_04260 [candidate division NC10 bacterium]|nr:hypothetical protein [candidate division NC10 bacterium]